MVSRYTIFDKIYEKTIEYIRSSPSMIMLGAKCLFFYLRFSERVSAFTTSVLYLRPWDQGPRRVNFRSRRIVSGLLWRTRLWTMRGWRSYTSRNEKWGLVWLKKIRCDKGHGQRPGNLYDTWDRPSETNEDKLKSKKQWKGLRRKGLEGLMDDGNNLEDRRGSRGTSGGSFLY